MSTLAAEVACPALDYFSTTAYVDSGVLGRSINAISSGDAGCCPLERSCFPLVSVFKFTVLSVSSMFSATAAIATSPSAIVTLKSAIITGVKSVSGGVVTVWIAFAVEVPFACAEVGAAQSSE